MQFIEVGNVTINLDRVEAVDKRSEEDVHIVLASGQAYSFTGADAVGVRNYFTTPPAVPQGPVLEKSYPCGCRATGGRDLPNYCPEHEHGSDQPAS